jgi:hypothetical protein
MSLHQRSKATFFCAATNEHAAVYEFVDALFLCGPYRIEGKWAMSSFQSFFFENKKIKLKIKQIMEWRNSRLYGSRPREDEEPSRKDKGRDVG